MSAMAVSSLEPPKKQKELDEKKKSLCYTIQVAEKGNLPHTVLSSILMVLYPSHLCLYPFPYMHRTVKISYNSLNLHQLAPGP